MIESDIVGELDKIRDFNINLQICIINMFSPENHDLAISDFNEHYINFQNKKYVFLNFQNIFKNYN